MLIFRYENEKGYGPFTFSNFSGVTDEQQNMLSSLLKSINYDIHPTPNHRLYEGIGRFEDFRFGCDSIETLEMWFNKVEERLKRCGFSIKVYDCPDEFCVVDKNQIGFLIEEAEQLELENV